MDQVNSVTQAGLLTVLMVQMKAQMLVVMKMNVTSAVPMVNLIVAMDHVFMVHGHVMATQTVQMVLMSLIVVLLNVQMVNLIVQVMALNVFMVHGHVTE